jgi:ABC-type lipoprotein export system ATPase subunit
MAGFIKSTDGEVIFFGKNLSTISEVELNKLRKNKSAFIFQKLNLISTLTPLENLELVASSGFNKKEAIELLEELGLYHQINTVSGQLSTGEQQRVACARAIFSKPEVIFADEPTSSLDDINTTKVMELLLKKIPLVTLITVSHDHRLEEYFNNIIQFEDIISS